MLGLELLLVSRASSHEEGQKREEGGKWNLPEHLHVFYTTKESKGDPEPTGTCMPASYHIFA